MLRDFFKEKRKTTKRNMKIKKKKKKSRIGKGKDTVDVVDQSCIMLVRRLKEKSSKIIYTQNKS